MPRIGETLLILPRFAVWQSDREPRPNARDWSTDGRASAASTWHQAALALVVIGIRGRLENYRCFQTQIPCRSEGLDRRPPLVLLLIVFSSSELSARATRQCHLRPAIRLSRLAICYMQDIPLAARRSGQS